MSSDPLKVTHAITLKGPQLGWAIMNSFKQVENRKFKMKQGWYVLHVGAGTRKNDAQFQSHIKSICPSIPDESLLPKKCCIGLIHISSNVTYTPENNDPWASGPVCNIIDKILQFKTPIDCKGKLSIWKLPPDILEIIRRHLDVSV